MASNVKYHEVDRKIIYDFVCFIETLLIAFTVSDILVQISQKVHIDYSDLTIDI